MKAKFLVGLISFFIAFAAAAQLSGPSVTGNNHTVQQLANVRLGSYVTLTGNIVSHQRQNYFTFRDSTGEIRVEIEGSVWRGQQINPETKVQLFGEVDNASSGRYIWVKSLQVVQ